MLYTILLCLFVAIATFCLTMLWLGWKMRRAAEAEAKAEPEPHMMSGAGQPVGMVSAPPGSIYVQIDLMTKDGGFQKWLQAGADSYGWVEIQETNGIPTASSTPESQETVSGTIESREERQ